MAAKKNANDQVVIALIGSGGRGTQVILSFAENIPGVEVKYICDVDEARGGRAINELGRKQDRKPEYVVDMRQVLDDNDVDGVIICTPEHWHALASVWACRAGKDVYVEKNVTLSIKEGRKMIDEVERNRRVLQCGTQNRSAAFAFSAREYIQSGKLGRIVHVKSYCMLPRSKPWIVKPEEPVPEGLNWDLWLGPAPKVPYSITRHKAWYDWWEYSVGMDMADAIHVLDLARLALGDPDHPASVYSTGGRVLYDDDRDTPDIQTVTYDYGDFPFSLIVSRFGDYLSKSSPEIRYGELFPDWKLNSTRTEIYGTEGVMYLGRHGGGWQVQGRNGEIVAQDYGMFPDIPHQQDFIDAIRERRTPNGDILQGHKSAVMVHLANIAYRVGNRQLYFDPAQEIFLNNTEANQLTRVSYREGFEL